MANRCLHIILAILAGAVAMLFSGGMVTGQTGSPPNPDQRVLEDFSQGAADGFPQGWEASRSEAATRKAYVIHREGAQSLLRTTGINDQMRIFKRVAWNPGEYPIVTWKWRLRSAPSGDGPLGAVFVSLDTDIVVIPVATKYLWAASGHVGAIKEGGIFGAAEVTVRAGSHPIGQWVEERVNAYADFLSIHKHEPAPQAWGISLVTGPGVELDFGSIALAKH